LWHDWSYQLTSRPSCGTGIAIVLKPVRRQSLSDAVFDQLRDRIVSGAMRAGESLPAERALCEALGVNRGAVREALKRLAQARLVAVQHGGASRVLDYRASAGLELLPDLLVDEAGGFDPAVVRSVVEMRSALAPDIARLAALRGGGAVADALDAIVARMDAVAGDLPTLQALAMRFWSALVDATENVAYRLAYNSLRDTYEKCMDLLTGVLADELGDRNGYRAIATAVRRGDGAAAERLARELTRRGERRLLDAVAALGGAGATSAATTHPRRRA
jgi:GntR family transcriptional regulator, transcriptional repressor for pyruvate dehydrogenase complex